MLIYFYLTVVVHISCKWAAELVASLTVISKTRFDSWPHFLFFLPLLTVLFFFFSFSMVHLLNVELETQLEFTQVYNVWILNLQNNKNSCPNLSYLGCLFSWWAQPSSLTEWIKRSTRFDQLRAMMVWIIPKFPSTAKRPASTKAEQRYSFGILYTLMYDTVKEIGEVPNRRGGAVSCGP